MESARHRIESAFWIDPPIDHTADLCPAALSPGRAMAQNWTKWRSTCIILQMITHHPHCRTPPPTGPYRIENHKYLFPYHFPKPSSMSTGARVLTMSDSRRLWLYLLVDNLTYMEMIYHCEHWFDSDYSRFVNNYFKTINLFFKIKFEECAVIHIQSEKTF